MANELGNYDYLLGADVGTKGLCRANLFMHRFKVDHLHPEVRADMLNWATWILEVY